MQLSLFCEATCWLIDKPTVTRVQNTSVSTINEADPFYAGNTWQMSMFKHVNVTNLLGISGRLGDEDLCENEICSCAEAGEYPGKK